VQFNAVGPCTVAADQAGESTWGSIASRYGCPIIVLLHSVVKPPASA
jgi:hypothetical protein